MGKLPDDAIRARGDLADDGDRVLVAPGKPNGPSCCRDAVRDIILWDLFLHLPDMFTFFVSCIKVKFFHFFSKNQNISPF